ncbi:hypothetical protein WN51_05404 [Melipona quadrifasciata]|uniref:Uncharacterized protein n=1 Tax=Melipona quadrifasciata TaxID=166423 RepID=A0A0M8ZTG1_9HYME|nr:hypothetical protein WN51_05404 [Melipona quadrifasciata]
MDSANGSTNGDTSVVLLKFPFPESFKCPTCYVAPKFEGDKGREDPVVRRSQPSPMVTATTTCSGTTTVLSLTTGRRAPRAPMALRRETQGPSSPDTILDFRTPPSGTERVSAGTRPSPGSAPAPQNIAINVKPPNPRSSGSAVSDASSPGITDATRTRTTNKRAATARRARIIISHSDSEGDFAPTKLLPSRPKTTRKDTTARSRGGSKTTSASTVATTAARTTRAATARRRVTPGPPTPTAPPNRKSASPKRTARAAAISRCSSGSAATPPGSTGAPTSGRA